jgi:hypothetical protein
VCVDRRRLGSSLRDKMSEEASPINPLTMLAAAQHKHTPTQRAIVAMPALVALAAPHGFEIPRGITVRVCPVRVVSSVTVIVSV